MKATIESRLARLERGDEPERVVFKLWTVENGIARNINTGKTMTEAEFDAEERGKRFTFVLSPDDANL